MSWLALLAALLAQEPAVRTVTVEPGFALAGHRLGDLDGDGDAELVAVAQDGRVRAFRPLSDEPARALGTLDLAMPARALLDFARWDGRTYLVVASPEGTRAHAVDEHGVVAAGGATWIPRGRFTVRVGAPVFARIAQDVNQDGVNDILVPTLGGIELWQASLEPGKPPSFRKAATVAVEIERGTRHGFDSLADELAGSVTIPGLDTRDVNGDGRPDLIVEQDGRRAWHLQREDASFPLEPDVTLDLDIFKDTTPAPTNTFGTIAGSDGASYRTDDLDGDGLPDHVIAHRRKVWVFLGSAKGPQFTEPAQILITAEDVSACLVLPLDEDERPDLLFLKLQIPTVATLLRGLFGEWDVSVRALAYRNVGGGKFETRPELTNDLALRLPGIIGIMKAPERFVQRFEELEKRFRGGARGDLDGDGNEDIVLVTPDETALELWRGSGAAAADSAHWLGALLFDTKDAVWDVDRILATLGGLADRHAARLTGGRPPDARIPLRPTAEAELVAVECADLDGDGAREVVLTWRRRTALGEGVFDVLRVERER
jgi:hypothetical protein